MNSCLYDCRVEHVRLKPVRRRFSYGLFYLWLDLDELEMAGSRSWLMGVDRPGLLSFQDRDHWPCGEGELKMRVMDWLSDRGIQTSSQARVRMLALPRVLGFSFNPISFFFVYDAGDRPLVAVAEVENTFREKKLYLMEPDSLREDGSFLARMPKDFYVSPFFKLDVDFEFRFPPPADKLDLRVDDWDSGERVFTSRLVGMRRELTSSNILWLALKCPLVSVKVVLLIHWQAMLLWMRGVPWFAKSAHVDKQTDVLNPHKSIAPDSP